MTFGGIKKTRSNEVTRPTLSKTSQNKEMSTANFNERFSVLNDGNDSGVDAKFQSLLHEYADNVKENNQDNEFSESLNATTKTISTFIQKKYKTEDKLGMSTVVSMLFDMPKTKPKAYQKKLFSKVFLGLVKNDSGSISKALLKNLESALNEQKQKHTTGYKQIHELFTHHLSELIENETIGLGELEDLDDLKSVVTCFGGKVGSGLIKENTGIGIGQSEFQACFKGDKGGRETAILGLKTKLTGLYDAVEDGQADELSEFAASGLKTAFESALDAKDCNAAQIFEVLKGLDFPKGNDGLDGVISHAYEKLLESDLSSPSCFLGENADAFLDSELLARCLTIGLKVFQSQERAPSDSSGSDVSKKRKAEKTKKLFLKELKKLDLDQVVVLRHIVDSQHYFDAQSWTVSSKTKTNVNVVFNVLFPEKALKQAMLDGIKGRSQDKTLSFVKKQAGTSLGLLKCIDENQDLSALQVSYGSEMWSVDYHDKKDGCHVIQLKSNSKTKTLSIDQNNVVDIDGKTIENPDSDILVKYSGFFDSKDGKTLEETILKLEGEDKALVDEFTTWKAVVGGTVAKRPSSETKEKATEKQAILRQSQGEGHEGVKGSIEELRGIASKAKEHKGWLVNSDNPFQQVLDGIEGRRTERGSFKRLKEDLLEKFHELCLEQGWPYDDRSATETSGRTQTGPTRTRTQHINQFLKEGQYSQAEQNFNLIQGELKEKGSSAWTKMRRLLKQASKLSDILESSKISISLNTIGIKQTGDKKTTAHETKQSNLGSTQEEPFDVTSEADLSDFGGPLSRTSFIKAPYTNKTLGNAIGKKIKENEKLETTLKNKIKTYQDISRYEKIYTYFRKQVALLRKQASYFNGLEGSSDNDKKMQKNIQKKLRQLDLFFEKEKTFKKDMKLPNDVFEKLLCSGPAQRKEILDHKTLLSEAQKHEISTFLEDSCVEVLSSSDKDVVDALEGYLSLKGTDQERSKFQSFLKSLTTTDPFGQVDLSTELVEKQKTKIEEKRKAVKCDLLHLKLSTGSPWSGLLEEGAWLNATTLGVSSDKNLPKDNTATKEYIAKVDQQLALLDYGGDVGDTLKEALKKDLAQCDFLFDAHLSLQEKQDFQGLNLENCINALTAGDQDKLIDLDDAIETLEDTIKKYNTEKDGNLSYPLAKHLQKWLRILKLGRLKRIWDRFKQEVLSEAELEFKKQVFTAWLTHLKELTLNPIEVEPEGTITESEKLLWDVKNEACVLDDALSSLSETLDSLSNQLDGAADTSQTRLVIESFGCMKELDKTSFKLRNLYESDAYQRLLDREADFDPESSLSVDVDSLVYNINNTPLDELEWKIDVMGRHITTLVAQSEERASKNKVKSDDNEKSLSDFKQAINGYLKLITRKGERLYAHSTKTDGDKDRVLDFSLKEVRDDFQALSYWVDRFELVGSNAKNIKEKLQQEFNQKIWNLQCGEKQQGGSSGQVSVLNTRYNQAVRDQFFAIEELPIKDKTAGPLLISKQLHPDTGFNELRMYYNPLLRLLGTVSQDMKYESHYEVVETLSDRVLNDYVQGLSIAFSSTLKKGNEIKNQVLFSKEQLSGFDDHMRNHIVTSLRERLRTIIPFHEPMAKDGTVDPFVLEIDQAGNFVLSMRVADGFPSSSKVAYETVIQELKDRFYSFPLKRADQIKESLEGGDVRTVAHKKWISQQLVSKYGKETGTSHTKQSEHYRHADSFSNKHITNEDITKKHILNFQGNASKEIYTKLEERKKSVVESFGKRTSIVNTKVMPLVEKINKIFEEKEKTALNIKNQSNKIQTGSDLKSEVPSATTKVKLKFNKKEAVQVEQYLTCLEDVLKKTEGMDKESQKTTLFLYFGKLIGKMKDQMGVYALYKNSLVPFCRGTEEGVQYDFSHSEELGEMIDIALNILDACKPGEMSINWKDVHDAKNKWNKNMDNGKLKSDFKSDAQEKVVDELKVALQTVEQAKNEIIEGSTDTQLLSGAILSLMGDKINPKIDGYSYTKNELDAFFNDKTVKERLQQVDAKQLQAIFKELNNQSTPIDFQDFKALSSVKTAIGDDDSLKETGSNASKSLQGTEAGKTNFIAPIEAKLTKGLQKQFATAIWNALDDGIKQEWKDISPDQTDSSDKTKGPLNTFDNFFIEKMNDCVGDAIKDGSDIEKIRGKLTDLSGNGSGSQGSKITSLTAMLSEHMLGIDNKSKHKFLQKLIRKKYGLVQGLDSEDSNAEFSLKKTAKDVLEGTGVFNIDTSQLDDYRQLEFELLRLEFAQKLATESSNGDITVAQIIPALHQKNALSVAVAMESYCQSAYKNGWGEIKGAGTKDPKFDLLNSLEYEIEKYDDSKIQQFIERLAAEPENAQKNSEQDETKEPLSNTSERALLKAQHQDKNETNQGDNALKIDHGNELLLACKIWDAKTKNNHSEEKPANALKQTTAMKHVFDVYKTLDPMQQHVMMLFQGSCEKGNRYFNYSAVKKDKNLTMEETTSTQYKFLEKALNDNFLKNLNISEGEGKRKIPMQDLCGKVALEMDDAGVRAGSVKIHSSRLLDEKNSFPSDIKENLNAKKLYFFLRAMVVENRLDQLKEDGKINLDPNNTTSSDLVGGSLSSGTFDDLEKRVDELFDKVPEDLRKDVETIEKDKYVNEVQSAGLSDDFNLSKESISPYQAILEKMGLWNKDQDNETLNNGIFDEGSKKRKLQEAVCEFLFRFPSSEELDIKKIAEGLSDNKNTDNFSGALINLATNMPEPDANARGTSLLTMNMAKGDPDVGGENKYDSFIELLYCLSKKINIVADTGDSLKHLQEPASQFFKRLAVIDVLNYNAVLNKGYHDTENPAEIIIGKIEGNIDDSDSKSVAASELFKDLCVHKLTIKGSKKSDTGEKSFQEEYDKEVKRGFSKDQIKQKICGDLYGANEGGFGRFIEKQLKNQQLFVYEAFDGDKVSNTGITNKTVENLKKIWQYSEKDSSFKSVSAYLETIGEESLSEFFKIETNEGSTDPNQKTIDNNKLTSPLWAFVETPTGQKDDVETSTDQESQKQNPVMTWLDKNIKDFKQESQKKLIDKIFEKIKGNKKTHKISLPDLLDCISTVQSEEGKDTGKHTVSTVETPKNIYAELDTSELDQISSVGQAVKKQLYAKALSARLAQRWDKRLATDLVLTQGEADSYFLSEKVIEIINLNKEDVLKEEIKNLDLGSKLDSNSVSQRKPPETKDSYSELFETDNSNDRPSFFSTNSPINKTAIKRAVLTEMKDQISNEFSGELKGKLPDKTKNIFDSCFSSKSDNESNEQVDFAQCNVTKRLLNGYNTNEELDGFIGKDTNQTKILTQIVQSEADTKAIFEKEETRSDDYPILNHVLSTCVKQTISENSQIDQGFLETTDLYKTLQGTLKEEASDYISKASGIVGKTQKDNQRLDLDDPFPKSKEIFEGLLKQNAIKETQALETDTPLLKLFNTSNALKQKDGSLSQDIKLLPEKLDKNTDPKTATLNQMQLTYNGISELRKNESQSLDLLKWPDSESENGTKKECDFLTWCQTELGSSSSSKADIDMENNETENSLANYDNKAGEWKYNNLLAAMAKQLVKLGVTPNPEISDFGEIDFPKNIIRGGNDVKSIYFLLHATLDAFKSEGTKSFKETYIDKDGKINADAFKKALNKKQTEKEKADKAKKTINEKLKGLGAPEHIQDAIETMLTGQQDGENEEIDTTYQLDPTKLLTNIEGSEELIDAIKLAKDADTEIDSKIDVLLDDSTIWKTSPSDDKKDEVRGNRKSYLKKLFESAKFIRGITGFINKEKEVLRLAQRKMISCLKETPSSINAIDFGPAYNNSQLLKHMKAEKQRRKYKAYQAFREKINTESGRWTFNPRFFLQGMRKTGPEQLTGNKRPNDYLNTFERQIEDTKDDFFSNGIKDELVPNIIIQTIKTSHGASSLDKNYLDIPDTDVTYGELVAGLKDKLNNEQWNSIVRLFLDESNDAMIQSSLALETDMFIETTNLFSVSQPKNKDDLKETYTTPRYLTIPQAYQNYFSSKSSSDSDVSSTTDNNHDVAIRVLYNSSATNVDSKSSPSKYYTHQYNTNYYTLNNESKFVLGELTMDPNELLKSSGVDEKGLDSDDQSTTFSKDLVKMWLSQLNTSERQWCLAFFESTLQELLGGDVKTNEASGITKLDDNEAFRKTLNENALLLFGEDTRPEAVLELLINSLPSDNQNKDAIVKRFFKAKLSAILENKEIGLTFSEDGTSKTTDSRDSASKPDLKTALSNDIVDAVYERLKQSPDTSLTDMATFQAMTKLCQKVRDLDVYSQDGHIFQFTQDNLKILMNSVFKEDSSARISSFKNNALKVLEDTAKEWSMQDDLKNSLSDVEYAFVKELKELGVSEKTFSGLSETISKDSKPEKTNFEKWKRLVQTINTSLGNDESKKSIQKAMLYVLANRCLKPTIYFGLSESEHVSKLFVESLSDSDRAALFGLDNFQAEAKIDNLNQIFQYNSSGRYSREEAEKKTRQCFETMISGYGENPSSEEGATGDRDARLENIEKLRAIVSASYTPLGGHNTGRGVDQAEFGRLKLSSLSSSKSSFLLNVNQTSLLSSKSDKNRSTLNFSTDGPKSSENPLEINDDFILHYFDIAKGMHPNDSEVLLSVFTKLLQKNGYVSISKELLGLHQSLKNRKEGVEEKISNMIKTLKSHDSTTLTLPMFVGTPEHACLLLFKKEVGGQSGKATFTVSFYDPHGEEKNGVKRPVLKEKTGVSFEEGGNLNQLKTWVEAQLDPTMKPSEEGSTAFFKDVTVSTLEGESYSNNCVYSCLEYYMMRDLCGLEKMSLELDLSTSVKGVLEQSCALGEESFFTDDKNKGILVTNINSKQKALKGQFDSARKRFYDRKSQMDVLLGSEEIGEKCLQKMSTLMKGKDLAKTIDLNSFRQCYLAVRKYVRNMGTGVESIDEETKSVINDPYYKALEAIMDGDLSQKQDNDFMKSEITKKNGFFDLAIDSSLKTFFEKLKPYFPEEFKSEKASTELKKKLREFLKENWGSYKGKLSFAYTETSSKEGWYFLKEFAKDVLKDKNFKKEWVQLQMSYVNSNSDALKGEKLNNKFLFSKGILDDMKAYTANMSDSDKEDAIGQVVNWIINDDNFSKEDKQLTVKIFEKALGLRPQYEYLSYNTTAVNGLTETEIISKVREFEQQKQKLAELLEHQKVSWGSVKDVNKQNDANVNSFVSDYKKLAHALSLFDPNNKNAETKLFSQANQTNYGNFGLTMQDEDERIGNARTNFQNVVSDAQKLQGTIQATLGQYVQDLKNAYAEDQTEVTYIPKKEGKVKKLKDVSKSVTILKRSKGMLGMVLKKSDDDDVISKIDGFDKELNGHKENLKTEKESTASLSLKLNKVTKNEESSRAIETYKFQDEKNQEYASLLEHLIGSLNSKDELGLLKAQYYIGELEKRSNTPSDIQNLDTTKEFLIFARKKISRKQYYYEDLGRSEDHKFKNDLNTQYGVWSLPQTNLSYQKNQVIHIKDETLFKNIQATNGSNSLSECLQDIDRTKMYLHGSYFCYTQDMESSKPVFFGKKDLAKNLKHKSAVTESFHSDSEKEKFFNQLKSRYDLILSYKNKMLLKTISDTKSTNREALITQTKERLDGILSALGIDQTVDDFLTEKVKADNTALFKSYPNTEESFYQLLYDYKGLISNKPPYEEYASLGQWDRVEIFKGMELKKLVPFLMALLNKASEAPTNLKGLPLQGRIKQMDWISKIFNASSKKGQKIVSQTASGKTTIFLFMAMCFKHIKSMSVDETKAVFGENIDKLKTLPEKIVFCSPSKIPSSEGIDVAVLDPEVKTNGCLTLDLTKVEGVSVDDNGVLNFLPCIDEFHKYDLNDTVDIKYNKNGDSKIVKKTIGELLGLSAVMQLDFGWKKEENLSAIQESIQSDLETQKKEFDNLREKETALNREILRIGDEIGALDASDGTKINVEYEPDNDIITTAFGPYKVTGTNLRGPLSREFDTLLPGKKGVKSYWKKYFDEPYVKAGDNKQKKEDVIKKMVCRLKTLRQKILKEVLTPVASSYMQPSDLPNVWQVISKGSSHYIQEYRVSNPQYCPDKKTLAILCDFFNQLEEKLRPYIDASGIELPYEKRTSGRNPNVVEFEGKKVRLTSIFQEKITVAQSNPEEQLKKNREALKTKQNEMQTLKNKIKTQGELVQTLETSKKKVTDRSQKDKNKDLTFKDEWNDYKNAKQKLEKSIEKATFKNSDQDFVFKQDQYSHIAESLATKTLEQNDSVNTYIVGLPFVRFQGSEEPAHENSFINQLFNKFEEKNTTKPVRIFYKNQNGEQIVVMRESESGNIILQDLKKFYESNAMTDKDIKTNSDYTNATNIVLYAQNECTGGDFGEIVQCGDNDVARRKQIKMIAFHNIVSDDIKESPDKYNLADLMQFGGRLRTGNPNYSYRDIILPKGLKKNDALKAYSTCSNEKFKVSGDLYFGNIIADNFINLFKEGMKLSLKEEKTQRGKVSEKWKEIRDQLKKVVVDGETLVGLRNGIEIKKETDVNTMAEIMCKGFDALLDKNKNKAYLSYYRHKIKVRIKQYIELCLKEYKKEQERIKETYPVDN